MSDVLSQWGAEAKELQKKLEAPGIYAPNCDRILALINLVRKKDEALKAMYEFGTHLYPADCPGDYNEVMDLCLESISLTEELE